MLYHAAQQAGSAAVIARLQPLAHERAADAHPVDQVRGNLFHREAPKPARSDQRLGCSCRPAPIPEIIAHNHVPGAQGADDQLIDELLRTHRANVRIETQRYQSLNPQRSEREVFLAPARQARRRTLGVDEFLGTRLEYQHRARNSELGRAAPQSPDHLLVAEMHAVVIPHGQHAVPVPRLDILQTANEFHDEAGGLY
jgi:hypothetical protein